MNSTLPDRPALDRNIGAIVLAAGYSSRMGSFKPALRLNGGPALQSTLRSVRDAGIDDMVVVLGHRISELQPIVEAAGARSVVNAAFSGGMFTSVQAGVRALTPDVTACFVLPADIPLIRPSTLRSLVCAFAAHQNLIAYPVFDNRRGHPPLITRSVLEEASKAGEQGPLSALLARHADRAMNVPVADEAIHMDMDTPNDYAALVGLSTRRDIPTAAESAAILSLLNVAPQVIRHSRAVLGVAITLAEALAAKGSALELELVRAGALLHDVAKGRPHHAQEGAAILRSMDFPRVATVVASHMEPEADELPINESTLVFLADKLVRGESYVGLDERFRPALTRFADDTVAQAAVCRRMFKARAVMAKVETRLEKKLDEILRAPAMAT